MNAFEKLTEARDLIHEVVSLMVSAERPRYGLIKRLARHLHRTAVIADRGQSLLELINFPTSEVGWFNPPVTIAGNASIGMWATRFAEMLRANDVQIPYLVVENWFDSAMDAARRAGQKSVEDQLIKQVDGEIRSAEDILREGLEPRPRPATTVPAGFSHLILQQQIFGGIASITAERTAQLRKGYDAEHDDTEHADPDILWRAAEAYLVAARDPQKWKDSGLVPGVYPFTNTDTFRYDGARDALCKAGAFIAAAIDQLDRQNDHQVAVVIAGDGQLVAAQPMAPLANGDSVTIGNVPVSSAPIICGYEIAPDAACLLPPGHGGEHSDLFF